VRHCSDRCRKGAASKGEASPSGGKRTGDGAARPLV
jgi:hypothetical protein